MKKRLTILLAVACLFGCLFGCGTKQPPKTTEPTEATQPEPKPQMDYTPYLCPWDTDVVAQAKADGKIHYYFMAAEWMTNSRWGDSCLIVFPDGQTMLLDSGVKSLGPLLLQNLQKMGIKKLDYILISHPHSDHQNGVFHPDNLDSGVLGNIPVGKVLFSRIITSSRTDHSYVEDACKARGIPYEIFERGNDLQISDDVYMEVLWPQPGTKDTYFQVAKYNLEINENSMVVRFDFGQHKSLFAGDLHNTGELLCLAENGADKLDADLLKVPHHGHDTSSTMTLLDVVTPELAVATGRAEIPAFVRDNYNTIGSVLLYDLIHGYIHVSADREGNMSYETTRGNMPGKQITINVNAGGE